MLAKLKHRRWNDVKMVANVSVPTFPSHALRRGPEGWRVIDPMYFRKVFWPEAKFTSYQRDICYEVADTMEVVLVAGNQLGKDYIAGFINCWWFASAYKLDYTCRIVSTSVKEDHLGVLWGETGRFLTTSAYPLVQSKRFPQAPFVLNAMALVRAGERVEAGKNPVNYSWGLVAGGDKEALAGHHSETSLAIMDEASGLDDTSYEKVQGWAKRLLIFGNPHECQNFFRRMVRQGDVLA